MPASTDQGPPGPDGCPETGGLAKLRSLLLGPERKRLDRLEEQIELVNPTAKRISLVLPEAISERASRDQELSTSLMRTVEDIVDLSVQKHPKVFADALFPVMGPAIRKAIAETFRKMMQTLNLALEQSLSWQGLKWRFEALRSGRPFAEVVLLHSLVFRVEEVFLIHRQSGLLLQHVAASDLTLQGSDMISGMLTAIQDFVQDSFRTDQGDGLETIQVGELSVWIEQGPHAVLAGVIRGNAPEELRTLFQETLAAIHLDQAAGLQSFQGDATPLASVRPVLEDCLLARYRGKKRAVSLLPWFLVGLLSLGAGIWVFGVVKRHLQWTDSVELLQEEPGIVVTSAGKHRGKYLLTGLRDPLARDPDLLLEETGFDLQEVESRWSPYQSLEPEFVLRRAVRVLSPPEGVTLQFEKGELMAAGNAPESWLREARLLARGIAGVERFLERNTGEQGPEPEVEDLQRRIDRRVLYFQLQSDQLSPGQDEEVLGLAGDLQTLSRLGVDARGEFWVEVVGHADPSGSEGLNRALRQQRAAAAHVLLVSRGVDPDLLVSTRSTAPEVSPQGDAEGSTGHLGRKVTFQVRRQTGADREAGAP